MDRDLGTWPGSLFCAPRERRMMAKSAKGKMNNEGPREKPVPPGSVLHRVLTLLARAVAEQLPTRAPRTRGEEGGEVRN